jgi:hypothetical protein
MVLLVLHFDDHTATSQHGLEMAIFEQLGRFTFNHMRTCIPHKKLKS